ncbi:unnamed protein product [Periconia digitata]|uniref:Uncharacterized protein n=1 Tax=Periconia digitata TaxID=1303443 RepID=A0A9W4XR80_9PLEO|nr:unnamed protein product [Periconia digitata]
MSMLSDVNRPIVCSSHPPKQSCVYISVYAVPSAYAAMLLSIWDSLLSLRPVLHTDMPPNCNDRRRYAFQHQRYAIVDC